MRQTGALEYWFPAFAGMTNLYVATTRAQPGNDGSHPSIWVSPQIEIA